MHSATSVIASAAVVPHGSPSTTPLDSGSVHFLAIFCSSFAAAEVSLPSVLASSPGLRSQLPPPGQSRSLAQESTVVVAADALARSALHGRQRGAVGTFVLTRADRRIVCLEIVARRHRNGVLTFPFGLGLSERRSRSDTEQRAIQHRARSAARDSQRDPPHHGLLRRVARARLLGQARVELR